MDQQRRKLIKASAGLGLVSALPLQAQVLEADPVDSDLANNAKKELTLFLQDGAIYTQGSTQVQAGAILSFTNLLNTAVYLSPATKQVCPFTETWPSCIGPNQTVKRLLLDNIEGEFSFGYYPLAFAGDIYTSGEKLSLTQQLAKNYYHPQAQFIVLKSTQDDLIYTTQDPASDGEIIVQD